MILPTASPPHSPRTHAPMKPRDIHQFVRLGLPRKNPSTTNHLDRDCHPRGIGEATLPSEPPTSSAILPITSSLGPKIGGLSSTTFISEPTLLPRFSASITSLPGRISPSSATCSLKREGLEVAIVLHSHPSRRSYFAEARSVLKISSSGSPFFTACPRSTKTLSTRPSNWVRTVVRVAGSKSSWR